MVSWIVGAAVLGIGVVISVLAGWIRPPARARTRVVVAIIVLLVLTAVGLERLRVALEPGTDDTTGPLSSAPSTAGTPVLPSGTRPESTSATATPPRVVDELPAVLYLSSMDAVDTSGNTMDRGEASIRNVPFEHSVGLCAASVLSPDRCVNNGQNAWAEYTVEPGYTAVQATIGVSSKSPSDCRLFGELLVDGTRRFGRELRFGEQEPVRFDVTGNLRVRIQMHALAGHGRCDLIYGDLALVR
ncbi:hypothetical protein [Amycolatopsis sp.]|uniref:hypothetical protein n=1 Tax=Amycolatopsis sp. TaxID=37632 RepID=UPI002D80E111|nr:hypothetical protein [Amycolatopsis sp.]